MDLDADPYPDADLYFDADPDPNAVPEPNPNVTLPSGGEDENMEGNVLNVPLKCPCRTVKGRGKRQHRVLKPGFTAQRLFEPGGAMDRIRHALIEFKPDVVFLSAGFVSGVGGFKWGRG